MSQSDNQANSQISARISAMASCIRRLREPLEVSETEFEFFNQLATGEGRDLTIPDTVLLPVTEFSTEDEANEIWGRVTQSLISHNIGPSNTWADIDGIFEELALNAAQHSASPIGCSATVECFIFERETVYVIGVADVGIGIPSSLRKNPEYNHIKDDNNAILHATELGVTGTVEQRGVGLHHVTERVQAYLGELAIISGAGFMMVRGGQKPLQGSVKGVGYHKGTIALVSLPIPQLR